MIQLDIINRLRFSVNEYQDPTPFREGGCMLKHAGILIVSLFFCLNNSLFAEELYLDSPRNRAMLRFELDNDLFFKKDSNFGPITRLKGALNFNPGSALI